ncbi:MAG TPA: bifunctional [glutamate--ammonia ligase]-adenylyl-L-tyrosine phosphorylase/[glutamate--ammonia-ligase] adenylyltransferase [Verrucomicrobiae bacterium]|jgi:glutamate-ammonia-ligase adenylyltransferase|nr:bifunctional [glutamate--ammonia ligase]-adenylyl-L-tyrosine phosphorylase/[glutamate--ammonia-ligase] adenylyltransferase [Verrucomicrobiae bacterium]
MNKTAWEKIIKASADPARVREFLKSAAASQEKSSLTKCSVDSARVLAALLSGSQFSAELLQSNPSLLSIFDFERLRFPRRVDGLRREAQNSIKPRLEARDYAAALAELRRLKQREIVRIAARDLGKLSDVVEITQELSDLADICLDAVLQIVLKQLSEKFGQPFHQDVNGDWQPTPFCVIGLGKLGGQELNYSSDVDVLFLYGDEGEVFKQTPQKAKTQRPVLSNHQFFCKVAEAFSAEVARSTADGFLFRIDVRLRPEGDAGPIARSLDSCENYYAQWGQTWERMMLIKARVTAGDKSLASEFVEMIQPFRFPGSISPEILREIAATKDRIEREVVRAGELDRNVKLGRGGIREIEFIVQSLQILHAGRQPFLQNSQTLPCLQKLTQYDLLSSAEANQLDAAYRFLRDVEHRLQMDDNRQTHTIPQDAAFQLRLARLMDFKTLPPFQSALREHTTNVRRIYDSLFKKELTDVSSIHLPEFEGGGDEWNTLLAARSFREPDKAFHLFREFAEGPGYLHVSPRTTELARQLIPRFLALCPPHSPKDDQLPVLSDPDRVLARLDSFVSAYGSRATLFEVWNNNPKYFELVLLLFDRSEFLALAAIHAPDLIDGLVVGGRLQRRKSSAEILNELRFGLGDTDQFDWLRRYHETELMRLGLRDISGQVDIEQTPAELSAFADACLQYALETVLQKNKLKSPPLAIIGLGKLGGGEIAYGSDLDICFVADSKEKNLPALQKMAAEVMDLLSRRTEGGIVFRTDARLRPDGEKGSLAPALDTCDAYYRSRAQLWEIQALTRARFVAGNAGVGEKFQKLTFELTDFSNAGARHRFKNWKAEIHHMRMRVEKERTPPGKNDLAIKTGIGGLMDCEFIAQALCLENGWHEPNTLRALERGRQNKKLPDADKLIENYISLRRVEAILRRWSDEGEALLPNDDAPYYRVSVRCGFDSPEAFRAALAKWRKDIRSVYSKVFALK